MWTADKDGSFNTQPPEGGWVPSVPKLPDLCRFNTQPPEGGWPAKDFVEDYVREFQHTAARRRLAAYSMPALSNSSVSTHSRPKAAGMTVIIATTLCGSFNTQPPEGGWVPDKRFYVSQAKFQHTAARRRLEHGFG